MDTFNAGSHAHVHAFFVSGGTVGVSRRLTGGDLVFSLTEGNQSDSKQFVVTRACRKF